MYVCVNDPSTDIYLANLRNVSSSRDVVSGVFES
jgi:hypothetical protein